MFVFTLSSNHIPLLFLSILFLHLLFLLLFFSHLILMSMVSSVSLPPVFSHLQLSPLFHTYSLILLPSVLSTFPSAGVHHSLKFLSCLLFHLQLSSLPRTHSFFVFRHYHHLPPSPVAWFIPPPPPSGFYLSKAQGRRVFTLILTPLIRGSKY